MKFFGGVMRNIEFRGKDIETGEWKYGYLVQEVDVENKPIKNFIIENTSEVNILNKGLFQKYYEIDRNTLGQYTGLKDKNGTKIYEGDIVELYDKISKIHWLAVVEFGNPNGTYDWGYQLKLLKILEPTTIKGCFFNTDILVWLEVPDVKCEVVGNIWDNPEFVYSR